MIPFIKGKGTLSNLWNLKILYYDYPSYIWSSKEQGHWITYGIEKDYTVTTLVIFDNQK